MAIKVIPVSRHYHYEPSPTWVQALALGLTTLSKPWIIINILNWNHRLRHITEVLPISNRPIRFPGPGLTIPFDNRHQDLVRIRLLNHALKAQKLKQRVAEFVELLRQFIF